MPAPIMLGTPTKMTATQRNCDQEESTVMAGVCTQATPLMGSWVQRRNEAPETDSFPIPSLSDLDSVNMPAMRLAKANH